MILYIVYDHHHLYIKKRKQICMSWVYSFYLGLSLIHLPQLFGNWRLWREGRAPTRRGGAGPTKKSVWWCGENWWWCSAVSMAYNDNDDDDEAGDGVKMSRGEIVSKALKPICQNSFGQRPKWLSNRWNKVYALFLWQNPPFAFSSLGAHLFDLFHFG